MSAFEGSTRTGIPFSIAFDGAEGYGYWIQFQDADENWYPLSIEESARLLLWAKGQLEEGMG